MTQPSPAKRSRTYTHRPEAMPSSAARPTATVMSEAAISTSGVSDERAGVPTCSNRIPASVHALSSVWRAAPQA